jgi:hypothetical protein
MTATSQQGQGPQTRGGLRFATLLLTSAPRLDAGPNGLSATVPPKPTQVSAVSAPPDSRLLQAPAKILKSSPMIS